MMDFHIDQALLAAIAGALSVGVKLMSNMVVSIKELNLRIGTIIDTIKDHEQRLRVVESLKHPGRVK
jgi:hypothetical protein